jgi:pimeloyl-ACP methyl ester carboxylesterase
VIGQVSPGQKVILLVHDWGCLFGYQFYARHPELVDRLIGVDIGDTRNLKKALPARGMFYIAAYQLWLALAWCIGGRIGDWMVLRMKRLMRSPSDERFIGSCMCFPYYLTWFGGAATYRKQFRRFEPACPMLFIYAKRKPVMFHTEPWLDELRAREGCAVVAFDTGHWIMLQQPERFNQTIGSWLSGRG